MKWFAYADRKISGKEIMIAVPSMLIGGGMLTLPHALAKDTTGSDGWIPIVIGGILAILVAWMVTKLATNFPNQPFITYASAIITKPVAIVLTCLFGVVGLLVTAFVTRNIANTAKEYLFDQTPVEVIALTFLLVVVYAVASSRIGLFRLNMLFFPFVIFISLAIVFFSLQWFELDNLLPVFQTSPQEYIKGTTSVLRSYVGIGILLFYLAFVEQPKKATKNVVLGTCIPIVAYIVVFIACLGVFGHAGTANLLNPTLELAKRAELPGAIFERAEIIFYVVWMMAIFNTATMAFDIAVLAVQSIFKKAKKVKIIFVLSPLAYVICMIPQHYSQLEQFGMFVSYASSISTVSVTVLLLAIAKLRGVKHGG